MEGQDLSSHCDSHLCFEGGGRTLCQALPMVDDSQGHGYLFVLPTKD